MSARSQWALTDLNCDLQTSVPQWALPDLSQTPCQIECQKEYQNRCHTECQNECLKRCQIECQNAFQIGCKKTCHNARKHVGKDRKNFRLNVPVCQKKWQIESQNEYAIYTSRIFQMVCQKLCQKSVSG